MIIEMLAQSETSSEEKAPQWGLVGLHSISTLKEFLYGNENLSSCYYKKKSKRPGNNCSVFSFFYFRKKRVVGGLYFILRKLKRRDIT